MSCSSKEAALTAARAADSKKAVDIVVQEMGPHIGVTDYFVIATASNNRQVDAIIDEVEDKLRECCGIKPVAREISSDGSWSLLDYGHLVIHVFQPETRDYYRLETLWDEAELLDLSKEEGFENLEYGDRIAKLLSQKL
ncbi:MAG: ribosome silencing factor [Eggerthellaceae bacterium]|nr:ribosome silencing factor [Eggerthellaceae bacterium]